MASAIFVAFAAVALLGCDVPRPAPAVGESAPAVAPEDRTVAGTWRVTWRRSRWRPRVIEGVLGVSVIGGKPVGKLWMETIYGGDATMAAGAFEFGAATVGWTATAPDGENYTFEGGRSGDLVEGTVRWSHEGRAEEDAFVARREDVRRFDRDPGGGSFAVATDPASVGVDGRTLDRIILAAEDEHSDALVIVSEGKLVCERYFGRAPTPMSLQSITKAVTSLAIGLLVDQGKIDSIDQPLSRWFPEFTSGWRARVTLRHILTHTSGLDPGSGEELNGAADRVAYARAAAAVSPPGTEYVYNNRAMQLLSAVIAQAAGAQAATYLGTQLFEPLGIDDATWSGDAVGSTPTYGGLNMKALDLAVLGQMLVDGGVWRGTQVVPGNWVSQVSEPPLPRFPDVGLGWQLRRRAEWGPAFAFGHSGSQGQYIWLYPGASVVAVRLVALETRKTESQTGTGDELHAFGALVDELVREKGPPAQGAPP